MGIHSKLRMNNEERIEVFESYVVDDYSKINNKEITKIYKQVPFIYVVLKIVHTK